MLFGFWLCRLRALKRGCWIRRCRWAGDRLRRRACRCRCARSRRRCICRWALRRRAAHLCLFGVFYWFIEAKVQKRRLRKHDDRHDNRAASNHRRDYVSQPPISAGVEDRHCTGFYYGPASANFHRVASGQCRRAQIGEQIQRPHSATAGKATQPARPTFHLAPTGSRAWSQGRRRGAGLHPAAISARGKLSQRARSLVL